MTPLSDNDVLNKLCEITNELMYTILWIGSGATELVVLPPQS